MALEQTLLINEAKIGEQVMLTGVEVGMDAIIFGGFAAPNIGFCG